MCTDYIKHFSRYFFVLYVLIFCRCAKILLTIMSFNMSKENTIRASFVEEQANGRSIQRNCFVDLQTGKIQVGQVRLADLKVDDTIPVVAARLEYRGQEFKMDTVKTDKGVEYSLAESSRGAFLMTSLKPATDSEIKESKIDKKWKPRYNEN